MAAERGPEPAGGPGEALFRFVRHWSRRSTSNDLALQGRLVVVLEAVNTLAQHGDVTVNAIASEVAVDQSGISGTLTEAAHAGLVDITSASGDRRHRTVSLTAAGRDVLADATPGRSRRSASSPTAGTKRSARTSTAGSINSSNALKR